ncbi:MAG: hypothetical protein ACYSSI_08910 [Planctomycetota bacterium]|jgi:hypothetical protein
MTEENRSTSNLWNNKTLIIAAVVVVLVFIFMYFHDQKQQRAYELRRLERRVELLEEWSMPRSNTPPGNGNRFNNKGLPSQQQSGQMF